MTAETNYPRNKTVKNAGSFWVKPGIHQFATAEVITDSVLFASGGYQVMNNGSSGSPFTDEGGILHIPSTDSFNITGEGVTTPAHTPEQAATSLLGAATFQVDRPARVTVDLVRSVWDQATEAHLHAAALQWMFGFGITLVNQGGDAIGGWSGPADGDPIMGTNAGIGVYIGEFTVNVPFSMVLNTWANRDGEPSDIIGHGHTLAYALYGRFYFFEATP